MFEQMNNAILLITGTMITMIIILVQCGSGRRNRKKQLSRTKPKTIQSLSIPPSQPVKISDKSIKRKVKINVEESSQSSTKSTKSTKTDLAEKPTHDSDKSLRLPKSESQIDKSKKEMVAGEVSKKPSKENDPNDISKQSKNEIANDTSKVPKNQFPPISMKEAKTTKDVQNDDKSKDHSSLEGVNFMNIKGDGDLILNPKILRWSGEECYQSVQLQNTTKERLAIKTKCSDNQLYRVNPVFGFIEPGQKLKVDVIRQKGVPKVDKMIFVSVRASKEDLYAKPLFKRSDESQKTAMLPLLIARAM